MTLPVFLYGTLRDPQLLSVVAGAGLAVRSARLHGYRVASVAEGDFPVLIEAQGCVAEGVVIDPDDDALRRLDFYELGFGYRLAARPVETGGVAVQAMVYFHEPGRWTPGPDWSLERWQSAHGALIREAAVEYMRLIDTHAPDAAADSFPQVRMRAASRLRARAEPSPAPLAPAMSGTGVVSRDIRQPYTGYFAVREDVLTFPLFGGGSSAPVRRASFQGGDAVTVLPYDPATDTVLVVRQFRHGPWCRGDGNPWTLEPAAGRIDPGETPEDAARRELEEEAGVTAGELHLCARYYPSPGAYSEFLCSYVGLADLSGRDGAVGGLDGEAEDIMAHVLPFAAAMDMVVSGAANTGPLVISLGWLAINRDRLRG